MLVPVEEGRVVTLEVVVVEGLVVTLDGVTTVRVIVVVVGFAVVEVGLTVVGLTVVVGVVVGVEAVTGFSVFLLVETSVLLTVVGRAGSEEGVLGKDGFAVGLSSIREGALVAVVPLLAKLS